MAQIIETEHPLTIQWGHDGKRIVQQFSRPVQTNYFTIAEAKAAIEGLKVCIAKLEEHKPVAIPGPIES